MKRIVCRTLTGIDDLELELDAPSPKLTKDSVRIDVHACGVNFPDTLIVQGKYQFKPPVPFAPGGEVAGVISEVGENVTHLEVGQRVAAISLWGGFADEIVVPAVSVVPIPDAMDMNTASGIAITYGTTLHAYRQRAKLRPGQTVLVLGAAGGVGLTAVEIATLMGAEVIAAASTEEKLALTREYGAKHTVCYGEDNLKTAVKALTGGRGVDVVYDPVGGDLAELAIRATAWEGCYLVIGFASGTIPAIRANLLLLKGCQAAGVFWGDFVRRDPAASAENMRVLFDWYADGRLKPHLHGAWPLERAKDALRAIVNREVKGKLVLTTGRG